MQILLIGNFASPYEEDSLHNLSLLNILKEEGHQCTVLNISQNPSKEKGFVNGRGFLGYVLELIRHGWKKDVIHHFSKSYNRMSLLKVMTTVLVAAIFRAKPFVTFHPEMFSVFGQSRSQTAGVQTIYVAYFLMNKVICGDIHTYNSALRYYKKAEKYHIIPPFIQIPGDVTESERSLIQKLQDKKKVIVFSNVTYPSLLFDVLDNMLAGHAGPDTGIAVSFAEKLPQKPGQAMREAEKTMADSMVIIEPDDTRLLSLAYSSADLVIRPMTCDGEAFYREFALVARKPERSGNFLYFPTSFLLIKEGEAAALCASVFDLLSKEKAEVPPESKIYDFLGKIKEIYSITS